MSTSGASLPSAEPSARRSPAQQAAVFLEMIKFQHTVFALPFAAAGLVLASRASGHGLWPGWRIALWVLLACVFARTAAMSFNRWADSHLDARNPRTATRAIPAGVLSRRYVLIAAVVGSLGLLISAAALNRLALALAPVALAVLLGYSYCKRFTAVSHFVLGLALGIAPIGAWVAVRGEVWSTVPLLLGLSVLLWTAGFDTIYACQDVEIDQREGLFSIPARLGTSRALWIARALHVLAIAALVAVGFAAGLRQVYFAGVVIVAALLVAEHWVVRGGDLRRIDLAFFTLNSWVGIVVFLSVIVAGS